MKRKHAGAQSKKHGCSRCGKHKARVMEFRTKIGRRFNYCLDCMKALGKV